MRAILDLIVVVLHLYTYVIIISAVLSWLVAFNIVNLHNDLVRSLWNGLNALTEPVLRPIRRQIPDLGGIDISPVIVLLLLYFIEQVIFLYIYPFVF
ncbi:YggT family protein [Methylocapsa palsarum]|uniref:YggT family protein n=1 Tax=Methylocapsa palsarum TaxID=1612308 RepID=A0A1I4C5D2_9HYPH|nr:YggT family protein [Methylocapsa palsarum]SFK75983.1 YggT family protein [Methylocapsa palsarum]